MRVLDGRAAGRVDADTAYWGPIVVAMLLIGAAGSWLGSAMSRVVAVVVYSPDAWRHGVWATVATALVCPSKTSPPGAGRHPVTRETTALTATARGN